MNAPGRKVICGSSTTEIASRELKRPAVITGMRLTPDTPPEYRMEGVDLITEGVLTLNQAMNLLEGGVDLRAGDGVVFRLCRMLTEAMPSRFWWAADKTRAMKTRSFASWG